jgi:hypothetical protein
VADPPETLTAAPDDHKTPSTTRSALACDKLRAMSPSKWQAMSCHRRVGAGSGPFLSTIQDRACILEKSFYVGLVL